MSARYDVNTLERRAENKRALQKCLGLPLAPRTPLIGVVSRLDTQKGFDIGVPALRGLLAGPDPAQVVVLGTGPAAIEAEFQALAAEHPQAVRLHLGLEAVLASRIYAGADLLLVPSRYEPCGLPQMIGLRYGAVPLVRATGGLADTVIDYAAARRGTGFVFTDYNSAALVAGLRRALRVYQRPDRWRALQRRGMRQALQFSWARSAETYLAPYQQAISFRKEAVTRPTQMPTNDSAFDSLGGGGLTTAPGYATLP